MTAGIVSGVVSPPVGFARALFYFVSMLASAAVLSTCQVITWPVVRLFDPTLFTFQRWTMFFARCCLWPLTTVRVKGTEHLPKGPFVIVSNHQSFIDPSICSHPLANVNFKTLFKNELLYYPFIGLTFYMSGHIAVKRGEKDSARGALERAHSLILRGCSVLFFAEGTTKIAPGVGPVGPFKAGAFIVAQRAQVPIVPITISGARALLPSSKGGVRFNMGDVCITVHPPLPPPAPGAALDELAASARAIVMSALRPIDDLPGGAGTVQGSGAAAMPVAAVPLHHDAGSAAAAPARGVSASSASSAGGDGGSLPAGGDVLAAAASAGGIVGGAAAAASLSGGRSGGAKKKR